MIALIATYRVSLTFVALFFSDFARAYTVYARPGHRHKPLFPKSTCGTCCTQPFWVVFRAISLNRIKAYDINQESVSNSLRNTLRGVKVRIPRWLDSSIPIPDTSGLGLCLKFKQGCKLTDRVPPGTSNRWVRDVRIVLVSKVVRMRDHVCCSTSVAGC